MYRCNAEASDLFIGHLFLTCCADLGKKGLRVGQNSAILINWSDLFFVVKVGDVL